MADNVKFVLGTVIPLVQDALIVLLILRSLFVYLNRRRIRNEKGREPTVSLHGVLFWVGSVGCVPFAVFLTLLQDPVSFPGLVFEGFVLLCAAILLAYCNETVVYGVNGFQVSNFIGRKRAYAYGEITGLSRKGEDVYVHCGRRRIRLDIMAVGKERFLSRAQKAYSAQYGRPIPVTELSRRDPMRGNLDLPWFYFFLYLFLFVASLLIVGFSVYTLLPPTDKLPATAKEVCTSFVSAARTLAQGGTLILHAPDDEKPYTISYLSGYEISLPDPETLCGGEKYFVTCREGENEYFVYALSSADRSPIIRAVDSDAAYRNRNRWACILLVIMGLAAGYAGVFGILVGRHPERYRPRFRRLFYKPEAWSGNWHPPHVHRKKRRR